MLSSANGTHTYQALMASVVATTATTSDSKSSDREGHQRSSGSDCEEGYAGSNGRTSGGGCQSSTTSDQTGSAKEGQRGAEKEEGDKEPGIFGRGGLLATPNVKVLLFLACVVQVRYRSWYLRMRRSLSSCTTEPNGSTTRAGQMGAHSTSISLSPAVTRVRC